MTITIFGNGRGLIHGDITNEITSKYGGVLKIGTDKISVVQKSTSVLPVLCNGYTGVVQAVFYGNDGREYELFDVTLDGGVIMPPSEDCENLVIYYKSLKALEVSIEQTEKKLAEMKTRKKETLTALNKNPLKYLIE